MGVPVRSRRLGVAEEFADDRQGQTEVHENRGMGMTQIVDPNGRLPDANQLAFRVPDDLARVVQLINLDGQACRAADRSPKVLDVRQWLAVISDHAETTWLCGA